MARDGFGGPKLPKVLLDKVQDGGVSKRKWNVSRKDRRKAERQQKKGSRSRPAPAPQRRILKQQELEDEHEEEDDDDDNDEDIEDHAPPPKKASKSTEPAKPVKSILKKPAPQPASESDSDNESDDDDSGEEHVSARTHKARLEEDDDEIAALEKKLGLKTGTKSKAVDEDGLDWLLGDSEGEQDEKSAKRKRPEDDKWLKDKRRKANGEKVVDESDDGGSDEGMDDGMDEPSAGSGEDDEDEDGEDMENPFSEDEMSDDGFEGFEEGEEDSTPPPKRERENPFVPPVSKDAPSVEKYVPPSLRKAPSSDDELLKQLRRQAQGQLNRVSEDNMLSIVQAIEQLYSKNARGHVTTTMVDLLIGLIADRTALNENFIMLHAGFSTALYKVAGIDFGAQLVERIVTTFDQYRGQAEAENKQTLNLLAFTSYLYTFGLVGPVIIFDFIRLLLEEVTETNTELLLRVIRTCGPQLRQDDPSSLKDVVLSLHRSVAKIGEDQLSVRTKFMMETINNLKNNRMKTGVAASAMTSEHTIRMKKTLGTLSTRTNKATEPLRISLADIRDSETKGKWWLVGASYKDPAKMASNDFAMKNNSHSASADPDAGYESETPGSVNLNKLARAQGMNTDVRRAVFVSLLSASDYKDGHMRLVKLHLKSKQEFEIPRVLLQCAGAESAYNQYYTLVAKKLCGERRFSKAFQFSLLGLFNQMGEKQDADDDDDDGREMSVRKVVNLAKLYGHLIADGGLSLTSLKTLQFGFLKEKTAMFVEVLLTTALLQLKKKAGEEGFEGSVMGIFARAHEVPEMIMGLRYFIDSVVSKADVAGGKGEKKTIKKGCAAVVVALRENASMVRVAEDDDDDESD
ncbi:hypothetical protein MBLNU230_g0878t1 [Neophaeotheca triangularis]